MSQVYLLPLPTTSSSEKFREVKPNCTIGIDLDFDPAKTPLELRERCQRLWKQIYNDSDLGEIRGIRMSKEVKIKKTVGVKEKKNKTPEKKSTAGKKVKRPLSKMEKIQKNIIDDKLRLNMRKLETTKKQLQSGQMTIKAPCRQPDYQSLKEIKELVQFGPACQSPKLVKDTDKSLTSQLERYPDDDPSEVIKCLDDFEKRLLCRNTKMQI